MAGSKLGTIGKSVQTTGSTSVLDACWERKGAFELREGMRGWAFGRYPMLYREIADGVEIVRAVHGADDLNRWGEGSGEG